MKPHDRESFEARWQAWSERPPRTPPAVAAARLRARLDEPEVERRPWRRPLLSAAWAAAAVVLVVTGVSLFGPPPAPPPAAHTLLDLAAPALGENVALIWLDSETPLYMSLEPPVAPQAATAQGDLP